MNRRDTSQNIMSMTKIKRTLHLNRIALLRKHTVDRPTTENTKPAVLHNWDSTGLPNHLSFPVTATLFHVTFSLLKWKNPAAAHSSKGIKRNQTAHSKVDSTVNLKCGLMRTKKLNLYTQCSFPRNRHIKHYLKGVSSWIMYIGWTRITVSEKAHICDLRLNRYCYIWKSMKAL